MARPLKDPESRMDSDLRIPVTSEQKAMVQAAAKSCGEEMAAWARRLLVQHALEIAQKPQNKKAK